MRTLRLGFITASATPLGHFWYNFLEQKIPRSISTRGVLKAALDQVWACFALHRVHLCWDPMLTKLAHSTGTICARLPRGIRSIINISGWQRLQFRQNSRKALASVESELAGEFYIAWTRPVFLNGTVWRLNLFLSLLSRVFNPSIALLSLVLRSGQQHKQLTLLLCLCDIKFFTWTQYLSCGVPCCQHWWMTTENLGKSARCEMQ